MHFFALILIVNSGYNLNVSATKIISDNDVNIISVADLGRDAIIKVIRIKNETVALAGLNISNTWQEFVWKNTIGENRSFNAEWVTKAIKVPLNESSLGESYQQIFYTYGPEVTINAKVFSRYEKERLLITFHSTYNGTHFTQAIITWKVNTEDNISEAIHFFVIGGAECNREDLKGFYFGFTGVNNNVTEVNRTVYYANHTYSQYNPTVALYNAILYMRHHNYSYIEATNIFLVPQNLLPEEYNYSVPFLWYIHFGNNIYHNTSKYNGYGDYVFYRIVALPNGTIVGEEKTLLHYTTAVVLDSNNTQDSNIFYDTIPVITGTAVVVIIIGIIVIRKKKQAIQR